MDLTSAVVEVPWAEPVPLLGLQFAHAGPVNDITFEVDEHVNVFALVSADVVPTGYGHSLLWHHICSSTQCRTASAIVSARDIPHNL